MPDLSDEAMIERYGYALNEWPEMWETFRIQELQSRPVRVPGGFNVKSDKLSVQRGAGNILRIQVGHARSMK